MSNVLWVVLGFFGQLFFFARFLVQWLHSEKNKRSLVPVSFWYLSILGAVFLLIYSIHRRDPVFISGQIFGFFVYARNLWFIKKTGEK